MRDGKQLAIDLHLPADLGPSERLPAIVRQTRYFRSVAVRSPFDKLPVSKVPDLYFDTRRLFLASGYAWVDVDVRGTGASFGHQPYPWARDEVADGGDVVSWIVRQPWSSGAVGSLGISYDGTTAEMLLCNNHPAVRAVAPMFSLFDVFSDVAFPGGIHLAWFTGVWSRFNRTLDANAYPAAMAQALWLMFEAGRARDVDSLLRYVLPPLRSVSEAAFLKTVGGALSAVFGSVRPTDDGAALLAAAIEEHRASFDIHEGALRMASRDDKGMNPSDPDGSIDAFSPHSYAGALRSSGAAIYSIGGYRDGAYQHAAVKRFRTVKNPGSRLLLGPFCHGGKLYCSAAHPARPAAFDMDAELVRFFDLHLRGKDDGLGGEAAVRYYTTGEEAWKSASSWPPPGVGIRVLGFGAGRTLELERGGERVSAGERAGGAGASGADDYRVDPTTGTGPRSRWRGLLGHLIPADYPDRSVRDRACLVYTSAPLETDMTVTGHPIAALRLRCTHPDALVLAYLEEETAEGEVRYLTEGQIRLLHRAVSEGALYDSPAPYHSFESAHAAPVPQGESIHVVFGLLPLSHRLARGSRVRLAIAGADADHFAAPPFPGASLSVEWGAGGSRLVLPVAEGTSG
jgi:putative CocE/NonD family hydrolase